MLRPWERYILLGVVYAEIAINAVNGAASILFPSASLAPLARVQLPAAAGEVNRWFGAVTLAFGGWLLARSLGSPHALRLVLEALCVGDVLYLAALIPFARAYGAPGAILAPFILTAVMFAARAYWLLKEDWAHACAEQLAQKPAAPTRRRQQSRSQTPRRR